MISDFSAKDGETVTVGTPFKQRCDRLWVGTGGNLTVTLQSGASVPYNNVQSNQYLYVKATVVTAATASNIVAERV